MLNLSVVLESSARNYAEKTAIVFGDMRLNYAQLNGASNQIANGLKAQGVKPGDRVALSCPNLPFFPMVYYGILKAGAVVVPLNVLLKGEEIAYHLQDSQAVAYFCFEGTAELPMAQNGFAGFEDAPDCRNMWVMTAGGDSPIKEAPALKELMGTQPPTCEPCLSEPTDTAVILYTSGTTGHPKGAELSHANIMMNLVVCRDVLDSRHDDIHLITLPLFHSFGQVCQMNTTVYSGATMVLLPRFDPNEAWALMERENITVFCGVPTMYWALLNQAEVTRFDMKRIADNLRLCASGGAAMPVELMRAFEEKYDVPILEGYGLSETSPVATFSRIEMERKPGSVGVPVWGTEVKVVDEDGKDVAQGESGEIVIRGHNVMKGYFKRPEATNESIRNGWLHTGDVGRFDEDGYLYIVDRVKDMIIRGGFNVYPRELEEVLMEHPGISMAAVIGVPDSEYGEEVKAFLVAKAGQNLVPDEVVTWCKRRMAAYKYPRIVEVREALPMTATGKILKKELRREEIEKSS